MSDVIRCETSVKPITFSVTCFGRLRGALGVCYKISEIVLADTPHLAEVAMYQKYEHLSGVTIKFAGE